MSLNEPKARPAAVAGYQTVKAGTARPDEYFNSNRYHDPRQAEIDAENAYARNQVTQYASNHSDKSFLGRSGDVMNPFAEDGFAASTAAKVPVQDERYWQQLREKSYERPTASVHRVIKLISS